MKKFKETEHVTVQEECIEVQCNSCGKTIKGQDKIAWSDITGVRVSFGFGSVYDMETWEFDLCDHCLADITSKFKIPPTIEE